jgi:hypothetical protein
MRVFFYVLKMDRAYKFHKRDPATGSVLLESLMSFDTFKKTLSLILILLINEGMAQNSLSLAGSSSHISGPNCWNGALYAAGVVENLRFTHPEEWLYLLEKNCEEIKNPKRGDVGRLYSDEAEVHGFIHLEDDLIFAKHGMATKDGYKIMSYEEMLDQYGKSRSCRISGSNEASCFHHLKYYRCYQEEEESQKFSTLEEGLEKILFSSVTKKSFGETCDSESFKTRETILKDILESLEQVDYQDLSPDEIKKEQSYRTQVYEIEVSNRSYKCKDRKKKYALIRELKKRIKEIYN